MSIPSMQDLLEAGMHFGHLTRRWNPKMQPYIYGVRNGIHIIDLSKTVKAFRKALDFITEAVASGADVLFVGTKKQAQDIIEEEATRCKMFYVKHRWLGGALTNFRTIKSSVDRLKVLQKKKEDGTFAVLSKKERLMIDREIGKLLRSLGGVKEMNRLPGVMVIVDTTLERIAMHEANLLGIPIVALADTNSDPGSIDYLVPGNDDALRSIEVFLSALAEHILEGLQLRESRIREDAEAKLREEKDKKEVRETPGEKGVAYVSREAATEAVEETKYGTYSASAKVETPESTEAEKAPSEEQKVDKEKAKKAE